MITEAQQKDPNQNQPESQPMGNAVIFLLFWFAISYHPKKATFPLRRQERCSINAVTC